MTPNEFRSLALSLPETTEQSHMDHPDFRVRGKIFASLGPGEAWGMVKLKPDQQSEFINSAPQVFKPANGAWGIGGATIVTLDHAKEHAVRQALVAAWRNTAPKRLAKDFEENE